MNQAISTKKYGEYTALIIDKYNNPSIQLKSIQDLLDLMDENNISPSEIEHLIITNNFIREIDGLEEFNNLKELNLTHNRIAHIPDKIIEYFASRVRSYSSPHSISFKGSARRATFILFLAHNPIKNRHLFYRITEENKGMSLPGDFIRISESIQLINNKLEYVRSVGESHIKSIKMLWEFGSKSKFMKELLKEKVEKVNDYTTVRKKMDFDDFQMIIRKGVFFITDVKPSVVNEKGLVTSQTYNFYQGIKEADVQKSEEIRGKEKLEERVVYFQNVHIPTLNSFIEYFEKKSGDKLGYLLEPESENDFVEYDARKFHFIKISIYTTLSIFLYYLFTSYRIHHVLSLTSFLICGPTLLIATYFWLRKDDKSIPSDSDYYLRSIGILLIGTVGSYFFNIEVALIMLGVPFTELVRSELIGGLRIRSEEIRIVLGVLLTLFCSFMLSLIVYWGHLFILKVLGHGKFYYDHFHPIYENL